jgi:hypothetical protein
LSNGISIKPKAFDEPIQALLLALGPVFPVLHQLTKTLIHFGFDAKHSDA